jgi:hypothetical protein
MHLSTNQGFTSEKSTIAVQRLKDSPEVFYSPQLVPLAHVLSDVSLNNAAI